MEQQPCFFCQIASGQVPARKVYEDANVIGILDIKPAAPGHILLLPKQHVAVLPQLPAEGIASLALASQKLSKAMLQVLGCDGTSIFLANGAAAGQRAPHLIMHVIPRKTEDGISLLIAERDVSPGYLAELKAKLTETPKEEIPEDAPDETATEEPDAEEPEAPDSPDLDFDELNRIFGGSQ